jgi:conjugal transfer pilus assembly protein TraD
MTRTFQDMFRPAYETSASLTWGASGLTMVALQAPLWPVLSVGAIALSVLRARQALDLYRFRASISALRVQKMAAEDALVVCRVHRKKKALWLGKGFQWTQEHAERAMQLMYKNVNDIEGPPSWFPAPLLKAIQPHDFVPLGDNAIGVPWIHGLEPDEIDIALPIEALEGHTLIVGTTRAGKTRLYELLATQIIDNGDVLIILDPKGDQQLEERCRLECERAGRKFLYMHPAHPSKSIRLNPLATWNTTAEPATRIGQLIDADGTFAAFAWKTLSRIFRAMVADGTMPSILAAKKYVQNGVEPLLERLIQKNLYAQEGAKWDSNLSQYPAKVEKGKLPAVKSERLMQMINKYESLGSHEEAIESLIAMVNHSKEHYSKMIQVLEPILEMLGSDEIGAMLSPDPLDLTDKRPIYDMNKIIEEGAVLYVGLDSLSNKIIGSAIGSILLADIASVAGRIYNFGRKKAIYLLIDEAAEVMNDQAIQILNKGGGAGFNAMIATQTIADFDAVFGNSAKTKQALGNLNNVICLRVKDTDTAEWIANSFGMTAGRSINISHSTGSDSSKSFTEFRGSTSKSMQEKEIPFVSADLLRRLPGLQYFAFLAGSKLYKGRLPLLH